MAEQDSILAPTKACRKCGATKPLAVFPKRYAATKRKRSDGHENVCRACRRSTPSSRAAQQRWRERNREQISARNKGRVKAYRSPEQRKAERARLALAHGKAYLTRPAMRLRALKREAMRGLLIRVRAHAKSEWYAQQRANRPSEAEEYRERYRGDPVFRQAELARTRKMKLVRKGLMVPGVSRPEIASLIAERSDCPYCGTGLNEDNRVMDHMDPLSKGGLHVWWNLIACCRSCNTRKGPKPFIAWVALLPIDRRVSVMVTYNVRRAHAQPIAA